MTGSGSKAFWEKAANEDPAWHIATKFKTLDEDFYESGRKEVNEFLDRAGLRLTRTQVLLELGCGAGRMTREFASQALRVIATDVSPKMLELARKHLTSFKNVDYLELDGNGNLPVDSGSVDAVFSYITMQHVPTALAQERYLAESIRVLKLGGWGLLQFRKPGILPRILDWIGHIAHAVSGKRTLNAAWRGSRIKKRRIVELAAVCQKYEFIPIGRRHIWLKFET